MRKIPRYKWFDECKRRQSKDLVRANLFIYLGGWACYGFSLMNFNYGNFLMSFLSFIIGIFLHMAFVAFVSIDNRILLSDKLDRIWFRRPEALERYRKRMMRKLAS